MPGTITRITALPSQQTAYPQLTLRGPMHETIAQAAARLGMSDRATHAMLTAGRLTRLNAPGTGPALVASAQVDRVALERRVEALRRVGDEEAYARRVMAILHPNREVQPRADGSTDAASMAAALGAPSGPAALRLLGGDPAALWGPDTVAAAAAENLHACRTCWARAAAGVHRTRQPDGSAACRILLGHPCELDTAAWAQQRAENRTALTRLRQQQEGRRRLDQADRVNGERTAAMRAVQAATRRFAAADAAWRALPPVLREGGRR